MTQELAQEIGIVPDEQSEWKQVLFDLERKHGELTPQMVLWEASRDGSPLHSMFTWDDTIAANMYREQQARGLIRSLKVKMVNYRDETEAPLRAMVNLVRVDDDGVERTRYLHVERVLKDDQLRAQMMERARKELASFRNKYAVLTELSRVFSAIDALAV